MEVLFDSIKKLENNNILTVNPNLKHLLKSESLKQRDYNNSHILSKELRAAARELKNHPDITVRKADKANAFVIVNKTDYRAKLDDMLNDEEKFTRLTRNPVAQLKTKVNKLIAAVNKHSPTKILQPIIGEYKPGYIYGTVKTHKNGNPLRPIVSQIPTPIYNTAKQINNIITPYLPAKYQINSTDDFLQILRATTPQGIIASLDAESLFTSVPVQRTIDIVCNNVYQHSTLPPPPFPRDILSKLLKACTTECPFTHIDGTLFLQKDGVNMGSPLGVTMANYYMTHLENTVLTNFNCNISTYCRFVDDCFIVTDSIDSLTRLKTEFENQSVLKFTFEIGVGHKLNYLDVHIESNGNNYQTSVYQKPTASGSYLNAISECPERYKTGTVKALIHRNYRIASDWQNFHANISIVKQALINNGYSNTKFDNILNRYLKERIERNPPQLTDPEARTHNLFYRNQYSNAYKTDERILRNIIKENTQCVDNNHKLKLIIYYKSNTINQLVSKNNLTPTASLKQSNIIYEYSCPHEDCALQKISYIGMTTTTLSRRLTMHLVQGGPKAHMEEKHQQKLTREIIVANTKIEHKENDLNRLQILEALLIQRKTPAINSQVTGAQRTLFL